MFPRGARVVDNEGDLGTVLREEEGRIIVDGDAGSCEWSYAPDELALIHQSVPPHVRELLKDLTDPDPCWYDHNDLCQAHHLHKRPCPHERAKDLLDTDPDD